jgi:uncharacterized protein YqeY
MSTKDKINQAFIAAMKAKDAQKRDALQLLRAEIKRREVDSRTELDETHVIETITSMLKQRKASIEQYMAAKRQDLVDQEAFECGILQQYLPTPLTEDEIKAHISQAITATDAESIKDMGKVMAKLKPALQGRADMAAVSIIIKTMLSSQS